MGTEFMDEYIYDFDGMSEYADEEREKSCFFTGHRSIPDDKETIFVALKNHISYLYSIGVRDFHAGGALGFDTLAATTVIDLKRFHPGMRLVLNLPYHNQTFGWNAVNVKRYEYIKSNADEIIYTYDGEVTDGYDTRKYLLKRNCDMVDCSKYGIAYFTGGKSGTGYTLKYAKKRNCEVVNIYERVSL